jgi:hypothetical protein
MQVSCIQWCGLGSYLHGFWLKIWAAVTQPQDPNAIQHSQLCLAMHTEMPFVPHLCVLWLSNEKSYNKAMKQRCNPSLTAVFRAAYIWQPTFLYLSNVTMFSEFLNEVHVLICPVKYFLLNTHSLKIQESTYLPRQYSSSRDVYL